MNIDIKNSSQNISSSSYSQSGTGPSQLRYKKALKEISKLVAINTTCRKQFKESQESYAKLQAQFEQISTLYNELLNRMPEIESKRNGTHVPISLMQKYVTNVEKKGSITSSIQVSQQMDGHPASTPNFNGNPNPTIRNPQDPSKDRMLQEYRNEIKSLHDSIMELETKYNEKQDSIRQMQAMLKTKHESYIELEGKYGELAEELERIRQERDQAINTLKKIQEERTKDKGKQKQTSQQQKSTLSSLAMNQQLIKQRSRTQQLESKLKSQQQWSKHLQQQYQHLRKLTLLSQSSFPSSPQSSLSLTMPNIVRLTSTETSSSPLFRKGHQSYIQQTQAQIQIQTQQARMQAHIGDKMAKMEEELKGLKKEFKDKKGKYKEEIGRYRAENQELNERVASMLGLIHKQQEYIENYVDNQEKGHNHNHNHNHNYK